MGMNQPPVPQQPQSQDPQVPNAVQSQLGINDIMQSGQPDAQEPEQVEPNAIATFEEAIDSVLALVNKIAQSPEGAINLAVQTKALVDLSTTVKNLVEAAIPEVDPHARLQLEYAQQEHEQAMSKDQQEHQQAMDLQQLQMDQQKHQQDLTHKDALHQQTLKHNELNQALKEWQAQQQQSQQQAQGQQQLQQSDNQHAMNLAQQQQQMQLAEQQAEQQKENTQNKSNEQSNN